MVGADEVMQQPECFKGTIGVEGPVIAVDKTKSMFVLSCAVGDAIIPVEYHGRPSKIGSSVIAYGEIEKTPNSKFVFMAHKVELK